MNEDDGAIEDLLDDLQQEEEEAPEPRRPARRATKSLVGGEIEGQTLKPETVQREVVKLMKVLTITRTPTQRIADLHLTNSAGKHFDIEIDEATAKAIAAIFD